MFLKRLYHPCSVEDSGERKGKEEWGTEGEKEKCGEDKRERKAKRGNRGPWNSVDACTKKTWAATRGACKHRVLSPHGGPGLHSARAALGPRGLFHEHFYMQTP